MTLVLELPPDVESRLREQAASKGKQAEEYALDVLSENLPVCLTEKQRNLIVMLDAWDQEDATDDPVEIAARQAEWEEFKEALNRHHESDRLIYP